MTKQEAETKHRQWLKLFKAALTGVAGREESVHRGNGDIAEEAAGIADSAEEIAKSNLEMDMEDVDEAQNP